MNKKWITRTAVLLFVVFLSQSCSGASEVLEATSLPTEMDPPPAATSTSIPPTQTPIPPTPTPTQGSHQCWECTAPGNQLGLFPSRTTASGQLLFLRTESV